MGMTRYEGLVRIRKRANLHSSSSAYFLDKTADGLFTSSSSNSHLPSSSHLSDDVWYFCIAKAPIASLDWFTVEASTNSSTENDVTLTTTSRGAEMLDSTRVSCVEAVDGECEPKVFINMNLDEQSREQLQNVSFYVEVESANMSLLIETECQTQRDEWVTFLRNLLPKDNAKTCRDNQEKDVMDEAGDDAVKESELQPVSVSDSSISTRSFMHQGKSENLLEDDDPFGMLSLLGSALSPIDGHESSIKMLKYAAPGMFAMDHFGISVERSQTDSGEMSDSGIDVTNTELNNAKDPALAFIPRPRSIQKNQRLLRERSASNISDSLSSSMVKDLSSSETSRRYSHSALVGSTRDLTNACSRCSKKFGRLIHTPKICASCSHRFCRDHCNQWTPLITPDSIKQPNLELSGIPGKAETIVAPDRKRVCTDCHVRQQLLAYLQESGVYYASSIDDAGGLSRLVRWKFFDQSPKHKIERHVRAGDLGPLTLLSAMFKYRQQPFMFVVVLAQLATSVENCIDTIDFYWPQFLQWGFVNFPDVPPSVRAFYLFFLAATARRSVHLAVKATWECIAAHWDAMTEGYYKRGHGTVIMLFFVTNVNFGESRSVLPQLLFPHAPPHQRESLAKLFDQLYEYVRQTYAASQRESPFFEWLLARSKEEIVASTRNIQKQFRVGDGFLDPFPLDYFEEAQLMILENRRSHIQQFVETKQRMWNRPALRSFGDEFRLVRFLVDLCTYLKENISEPSKRKKLLPVLLHEMLRGKHIRPEAALPLCNAMANPFRVVNVLVDEGTVFSTKARAPTLVYFEIIALSSNSNEVFHDSNIFHENAIDALFDAAVKSERDTGDVVEPEQQEMHNYLDGKMIEMYMLDLVPPSQSESQSSFRSSLSEDMNGLSQDLLVDRTQSVKGSNSVCSENDGSGGGTQLRKSTSSANDLQALKCIFFGERFADMQDRIRERSTFSRFDGWALAPVIAKSFDDMRQEVFVMQGLKLFQLIFRKHKIDLWLRYYSIVCAGKDCGLLEVITDAQSLDSLKKIGTKVTGIGTSLLRIFERACGRDPIKSEHDLNRLEEARTNYISSMAAYSLFSYIFLVKDRHNGNIMLDTDGHVVHIDFGFILGIAPGNTFSLETAPFKLTPEMVAVMGDEGFDRYRQLVFHGLLALHLEAHQLMSLVYLSSKDSCFPCFKGQSRARIVRRLGRRLCIGLNAQDVERTAARIVDQSYGHRGTRQYDWFQKISNGILP
ncbi:hypothetical protein CCR75_002044 [Bremia lactucae]|uniref:PI3K/PI4K catalytic domain-containing protein n=1 Tax=Bremia lactucae TaxID=4779 RepID=A0A976FFP6_BRELC|nr:hypothetical protein CCR75_002044 [Bremia lactucae]